jgi:hypothetical protein
MELLPTTQRLKQVTSEAAGQCPGTDAARQTGDLRPRVWKQNALGGLHRFCHLRAASGAQAHAVTGNIEMRNLVQP